MIFKPYPCSDRRSPGSSGEGGGGDTAAAWSEISIVDTDTRDTSDPGDQEEKLRDLSFTDIALRRSAAPILHQLPQNAAQLNIDSFVPADCLATNTGPGKLQGAIHQPHSSNPALHSALDWLIQLCRLFVKTFVLGVINYATEMHYLVSTVLCAIVLYCVGSAQPNTNLMLT